ncbi:hypothetical protein KSC_016900 [Ktedonobacter sp. SOSP1-52]|nr:hypothetical protein KSC_016900 [Ktedonobacter sp. SOSP1-52]
MRTIIEHTLVSLDGVSTGAAIPRFGEYRDDEEYNRDRLDQALSCEALLIGRTTYELFAKNFPIRTDPWGERINAMPKYVFSSTLEKADGARLCPGSPRGHRCLSGNVDRRGFGPCA